MAFLKKIRKEDHKTRLRRHTVSEFEKSLVKGDFGVEPVIIEHGVEEWLTEVQWNPSDYVLYNGRIEKYKTSAD
ncbi:MAG: hypothetical protein QW680_10755 [Pyrobaculum sp.]